MPASLAGRSDPSQEESSSDQGICTKPIKQVSSSLQNSLNSNNIWNMPFSERPNNNNREETITKQAVLEKPYE